MRRPSVLLFFGLIIITSASAGAQQETRRPGFFVVYGPAHTIRDERVALQNENGTLTEGPRVLLMTLTFNEDGTRQESTVYQPTGEINHRRIDLYEPDGRITETSVFGANDTLQGRSVTLYDDQKQRSEIVMYRADGSIVHRTTFHRTGNNMESETVGYDAKGLIIDQTKGTLDLRTRQSQVISVNAGGTIQTQQGITDNPDGSQEFRADRSNGEFQREVSGPARNGTSDRVIYNRDGTVRSTERLISEFDSHRNLIKTTHLTARGDSTEFEPVDITYRTITYY